MFRTMYSLCSIALAIAFSSASLQAEHPTDVATNGVRFNTETKSTQFVVYNPLSNTSTVLHDFGSSSVLVGSSTVNPQSGVYYFTHTKDGKSYTVVGINSQTGEVLSEVDTDNHTVKEAEFDYKTGTLYGIRATQNTKDSSLVNPTYTVEFVRIDPATSAVEVIRELTEFDQVVVNTSCYNSNTGEYIIAGINTTESLGKIRLYVIDAQSGKVVKQTNPLEYRINALQYDNKNNAFIGFVTTGLNTMQIATINYDGEFQVLSDEKFAGIWETHIAYDQMKSLLVARVINPEKYAPYTIVFNTESKEFVSNIPTTVTSESVHEWEISNQEFAALFYQTSAVEEEKTNYSTIQPNPVHSGFATIQGVTNFSQADVYSITGVKVHTSTTPELQLSSLASGVYKVLIHNNTGGVITKQLVITR